MIINILVLFLASLYLAQHKLLWFLLFLLNLPIAYFISQFFYPTPEQLKQSLSHIFKGADLSQAEDERQMGLYGWLFVATCLALLTIQYKTISWLII